VTEREFSPRERVEVDYAGDPIEWIELATGEIHKARRCKDAGTADVRMATSSAGCSMNPGAISTASATHRHGARHRSLAGEHRARNLPAVCRGAVNAAYWRGVESSRRPIARSSWNRKTHRCEKWVNTSVRSILFNPLYTGRIRWIRWDGAG